ncbi:MAG: hypothetical protein IPG85_08400 [Bacteroidetes bacterium]|nr:hypothetical protein [Bacteroidota bacterium]
MVHRHVYSIDGGAAIDALGNATSSRWYHLYHYRNRCQQLHRYYNNAVNGAKRTSDNYQYTTAPTYFGCDGTTTTITAGGTQLCLQYDGGAAIDALGNATNLCDGITYTITVTDTNGCIWYNNDAVNAPNAPTITINTTTAPTCVPGCDGTATTITAGGTPAFAQHQWWCCNRCFG